MSEALEACSGSWPGRGQGHPVPSLAWMACPSQEKFVPAEEETLVADGLMAVLELEVRHS